MSQITRLIPSIRNLAERIESTLVTSDVFSADDVLLLRGLIIASIEEEKSIAGMKAAIAEAVGLKIRHE